MKLTNSYFMVHINGSRLRKTQGEKLTRCELEDARMMSHYSDIEYLEGCQEYNSICGCEDNLKDSDLLLVVKSKRL